MAITQEQTDWFAGMFDRMTENVCQAVLGKQHVVRLALTCMLSEGHLLLEDRPGTGKTSLAKALSATVAGTHSRIQFTPDLLPSDVTGVQIYQQRTQDFEFQPGPIFHSIVLADEINRASPKTQSALLEVMEEGKVTVDGTSHSVGRPFMVIATQNPVETAGTYPLPEAQLDRFLMKTSLGYPDQESTVMLLSQAATRDRSAMISPIATTRLVAQMSAFADEVKVDVGILRYVSQLAEESRRHKHVQMGLSVRGCLAFVRTAKTWAASQGRTYVLPDDIKVLAQPLLCHRLLLDAEAQFAEVEVDRVITEILQAIPAPHDRVG